jgi:hypothetical protein
MSNLLKSRILWGSILIIGGILFLMQNLFGFQFGNLFWALVLGLGGLFFLSIFFTNRTNWWGLIPGITLLSVALLVALGAIAPDVADTLGATIVLGGIGVSFVVVYLLNREFWWAIIPSGVLLSLSIALAFENFISDTGFVSIFFLGMALTFAVVAQMRTPEGRMQWAWIPAGILGVIGIAFGAFSGSIVAFAVPVILIAAGAVLIFRTLVNR